MTVEEIQEKFLSEFKPMTNNELHDLGRFMSFAQDVASLFPVNEDEQIRMARFARTIWRCSELYHNEK